MSKKNNTWQSVSVDLDRLVKYFPLIASTAIFIVLAFFSFSLSNKVDDLTNNLDDFYVHPYNVRNSVHEFHLNVLEIVHIWSGHSGDIYSETDIETTITRRFALIDSNYSIIKNNYLGPKEEPAALWQSYTSLEQYITKTGFRIHESDNLETYQLEVNLLLNDIINKLKPIEDFAINRADKFIRQAIVDKNYLLVQLNQLYAVTGLFFIIGLAFAAYIVIQKNLGLTSERKKFKKSIEFAPIPIMIHKNGMVLELSKEWVNLTGYTIRDIPSIEQWIKKAYGGDTNPTKEFIFNLYTLEKPQDDGIWTIKTKSGEERIWRFHSGPLGDDTAFSTAIDVTEEVKKQQKIESLYEQNLRLAEAVDQSPVSIIITDTDGNIEYVNKYFSKVTGYSFEEVFGKNPKILQSGNHEPKFYKNLWKTISHGNLWSGTIKNRSKDGSIIWESVSISPIFDEDKNIINYVAVKENITEKRHAQEALQRSEKKYRDLFTLSTDASLIIKEGVFVDCNNAALQMLGMNDKNELIGCSPVDISPVFQADGTRSDNKSAQNISKAMKEKHHRFEWLHQNKQGELMYTEVVLTKIDEGSESHLFVVWRNISDRKKYETELKAALDEREILLSEVHHRVKNNLAIISGLMQIQMYKNENSESSKVLAKSINRIKSIALIHEQLYQSEQFSHISLKENIEKQVRNQMDMFESEKLAKINIEFALEEVFININQILPIGLLLNEIITNAFKYAFNGRDSGKITIQLSEKNKMVYLVIKDDGVGLNKKDKTDSSTSMGLTLIDTFVDQLEGTCEIDTSRGTAYHITFKKQNIRGSMASKLIFN